MKKLLIVGCVLFFIFCAPKKTTVQTEGLEEVVVFGEETNISTAPVLPTPESLFVAPPAEETLTPPPVGEVSLPPVPETILPPVTEITPPPLEEVVTLPPLTEVTPPPMEEVVTLPPLTEITPPPMEEIAAVPPTIPPVSMEEGMTPPPTVPSTAPAKIFGFRVQIFASATEKNASRVAEDARAPFGGKVYVEYVPPYYKVRIGNCLTTEDAALLKNKAMKLGYKGAFVIETMITP